MKAKSKKARNDHHKKGNLQITFGIFDEVVFDESTFDELVFDVLCMSSMAAVVSCE